MIRRGQESQAPSGEADLHDDHERHECHAEIVRLIHRSAVHQTVEHLDEH